MGYGGYGFRWAPYVSVGQKLAMAERYADKVAKRQKRQRAPVELEGRTIAKSFWGEAWCDNLEAYSDFDNRLPRGARYVRNGSVVDLVIRTGKVEAIVAGSEPYQVEISIAKLAAKTWNQIKRDCAASIDSLIDLLSGQLSDGVMERLTQKRGGCFPYPKQIDMRCSCPDYSDCCKHIAAVMYAIGSRLDEEPELLFLLRGVDHQELVSQAVSEDNLGRELAANGESSLADADLGAMFGIELEQAEPAGTPRGKASKKKPTAKTGSRVTRGRKTGTNAKSSAASLKSVTKKRATKKKPASTKTSATKRTTKSPAAKKKSVKSGATKVIKKKAVKKKAVKKTVANKKTGKKKSAVKKVATKKKTAAKKAAVKKTAAKNEGSKSRAKAA